MVVDMTAKKKAREARMEAKRAAIAEQSGAPEASEEKEEVKK